MAEISRVIFRIVIAHISLSISSSSDDHISEIRARRTGVIARRALYASSMMASVMRRFMLSAADFAWRRSAEYIFHRIRAALTRLLAASSSPRRRASRAIASGRPPRVIDITPFYAARFHSDFPRPQMHGGNHFI